MVRRAELQEFWLRPKLHLPSRFVQQLHPVLFRSTYSTVRKVSFLADVKVILETFLLEILHVQEKSECCRPSEFAPRQKYVHHQTTPALAESSHLQARLMH